MHVDRSSPIVPAEIMSASADPPSSRLGSVVVYDCLHMAFPDWSALQAAAPASPYQTWEWVLAWTETEGRETGVTPMIVVGYDHDGRAIVLLPLGLRRVGPVQTAVFLGGRQSNYNMALFAPGPAWSHEAVKHLLHLADKAARPRPDVYALRNQPFAWNEVRNPLALLRHRPSPSSSHRAVLSSDPDVFLRAHQSASTRKKLRGKLAALNAIGPVTHLTAATSDEVAAVIDAHIAQKAAKLGPSMFDPVYRRFLLRACGPDIDRTAPLELHALLCGARIVATFGGVPHAGRFSGLLISHDADAGVARNSPGELLLSQVVSEKCREGFAGFDLGIGEARYKQSLCPIDDPLFDSFVPLTLLGRVYVASEMVRLSLKRAIKRSPRAWAAAKHIRRLIAGMPHRTVA